jgi:hypothetical protein
MPEEQIKIGGSLYGVANIGNRNLIINQPNISENEDVSKITLDILNDLAQRYPHASDEEKKMAFQMDLREKIRRDPTLKARLLNSVKAGGFELTKVLTNNPLVGVPIEMVKGWIEAE